MRLKLLVIVQMYKFYFEMTRKYIATLKRSRLTAKFIATAHNQAIRYFPINPDSIS